MSLRLVEVQEQDLRTPAEQPAPILDWIQIDRLRIDDGYQRALGKVNMTAIRRIAENFMWSRFTPVLVAPIEGGLFAIIDGQHRTHAALMCGFSTVPAMAVHVARSEQARAFQWVNQQSIRVTPHQVYRAALAAGDDWARGCAAAVSAAGCELMPYNASSSLKKPGQIYSINLVRSFVDKGKAGAITAALRGLRQYDERGRVGLYSDYILRPWFQAVASDRSFEALPLAEVLRAHDPYKVIENAHRLRSTGIAASPKDAFIRLLKVAA